MGRRLSGTAAPRTPHRAYHRAYHRAPDEFGEPVSPIRLLQVLAVVGATTVGAAMVASTVPEPEVDDRVVHCYRNVSLAQGKDFHGVVLPLSRVESGNTLVMQGPVSRCAQAWQAGLVKADGVKRHARRVTWERVPQLVACTLPDRRLVVYPGPADTCDRVRAAAFRP